MEVSVQYNTLSISSALCTVEGRHNKMSDTNAHQHCQAKYMNQEIKYLIIKILFYAILIHIVPGHFPNIALINF